MALAWLQLALASPPGTLHIGHGCAGVSIRVDTISIDYATRLVRLKEVIAAETASEEFKSSSDSRYLVFVNSLTDGVELAKDLGLELYHAHSKENPIEDDERRAVYTRWTEGRKVGMVCTTALAAGNDYAHVRFTAHFNAPYDATTFVQQAGRAGRDGEPARNWILASRLKRPDKAITPLADDLCGKRAMSTLTHPPFSY
ncbi:P-loop containing nucleoside triphosphate hydrolase protein [Mycena olivaceomarginata]|nr:P-loop containing nucleoside triphosphate hydrolase protein [Mycena olivaceomarginata]